MLPNCWFVATGHLPRRNITIDAGKSVSLFKEFTYPRSVRQHSVSIQRIYFAEHSSVSNGFSCQLQTSADELKYVFWTNTPTQLNARNGAIVDTPLHRTMWQYRKAIVDHLTPHLDSPSNSAGALLTRRPSVVPSV